MATEAKKQLRNAIKDTYPSKPSKFINDLFNEHWKGIVLNPESHRKKILNQIKLKEILAELKQIKHRKRSRRDVFWTNKRTDSDDDIDIAFIDLNIGNKNKKPSNDIKVDSENEDDDLLIVSKDKSNKSKAYKQDEILIDIGTVNEQIAVLSEKMTQPFIDLSMVKKEMKRKQNEKVDLQKQLKRLKQLATAQSKRRAIMKEKLKIYKEQNPDDQSFIIGDQSGRPNIEKYFPHFGACLMDIVNEYCATDPRRRCELLTYCDTLDQFTEEAKKRGFEVSRSALYLRIIPRRADSVHGKHHVHTIPVKFAKPQDDEEGDHISKRFCLAEQRMNKQIAATLGPEQATYWGIDIKCKVPMGIRAAQKQQGVLMRLEYKLKLPDHSFVVAAGHKLDPTVIGIYMIKPNMFGDSKAVTYSGPTLIRIRSQKHDTSGCFDHGIDILHAFNKEEFKQYLWNATGPKPVCIIRSDGANDLSVRNSKVVRVYIHIFKCQNLDVLVISISSPLASKFNEIERRMAPLSKAIVGLILDYAYFGSHLDGNAETIDIPLEKRNHKKAGEVLGEVWSQLIIDEYPVYAEWVDPIDDKESRFVEMSEEWKAKHVTYGQYHLSILKCEDTACCGVIRSNIFDILPNRKWPQPIWFTQKNGIIHHGSKFTDPPKGHHYASFPIISTLHKIMDESKYHDDFNPLFNAESILSTVCRHCLDWFPSKKLMLKHRRALHPRSRVNNIMDQQEEENDYDGLLCDAEIEFYESIDAVTDYHNGLYLADGHWVYLPDDNQKVIEYEEREEREQEERATGRDGPMQRIDDLREWNRCPWVGMPSFMNENKNDE